MKIRKIKTVVSYLLALMMVLSSVPLPARAAATHGLSQDSDGYYTIATADVLYAFAEMVNAGNTAINGRLTADIVVNEGTMIAETTGARV